MEDIFARTRMLWGDSAVNHLSRCRVAVFGIGGVGGHATEVLARSGIGALDLIDGDYVSPSNINRQIVALQSTIGKPKVEVAKQRILDINPLCTVRPHALFYLPDKSCDIDFSQYDYVADCIDTISAKIDIIIQCKKAGIPIISCMGAANKLDPTAFRVSDISQTRMDPLAKIIRKKLRLLGIHGVKVVFSEEPPIKPMGSFIDTDNSSQRIPPASNAFVPASAGLVLGGEIIKSLIQLAPKDTTEK